MKKGTIAQRVARAKNYRFEREVHILQKFHLLKLKIRIVEWTNRRLKCRFKLVSSSEHISTPGPHTSIFASDISFTRKLCHNRTEFESFSVEFMFNKFWHFHMWRKSKMSFSRFVLDIDNTSKIFLPENISSSSFNTNIVICINPLFYEILGSVLCSFHCFFDRKWHGGNI